MDQNNFRLNIGRQVRLYRKAQGISQEKLAELTELHHTYISNIERGKISASAFNFYRISKALGIKYSDLFRSIDEGSELDFEKDLISIVGKLKQMENIQRDLYLCAIKGMLSK